MREAGWACLEEVQQVLAQGREGKACDLALRYFSNDYQDPELFYAWAKTFELLGMAKKAIGAYGLALKLSPDNPRYLKPLAILFYETGRLKEAFHSLKRLRELCPEDRGIKKYWTALLKELGFEGAYEQVEGIKENPSLLRYFPPSLGKKELVLFLHLFAGKCQGLVEQVTDENTGLSRLLFYDTPLDTKWVRSHLLGEKTLFFFPLREDKKTKLAILAFFISKRDRFYYARQPSFLELKAEALKEYALKVLRIINDGFALPAYLERVNRFFYRIWLFLEEFVHFLLIKRFLKEIISKLPYPEFGAVVEPYLPTLAVGIGWRERAILLPLGIERQTKERSFFLDAEGNPYPEQIRFLKRIRELSLADLKTFLRHPVEVKDKGQWDNRLQRLKEGCPVINTLIEKAQAGRMLDYKEKLVLFYTVGLLDKEGHLLHQVLYPLPDYNYHKVKRILKAIKPNPISCIKIRELLPELTNSLICHCVFDLRDGRYPSPLLHVNPLLVPTEERRLSLQRISLRQLAKMFVELWQERERIEAKLNRLEVELKRGLEKKGWQEMTVEGRRICFVNGHLVVRK